MNQSSMHIMDAFSQEEINMKKSVIVFGIQEYNAKRSDIQARYDIIGVSDFDEREKGGLRENESYILPVNCNSKLNTFIIHNNSQLAYTLSKNLSKSSSGVWYPSTRLGRLLRASANDRISSSVYRSIDSPLGI